MDMWTNMVYLSYTTYISVELAHHEIFYVKVGKAPISLDCDWFATAGDKHREWVVKHS